MKTFLKIIFTGVYILLIPHLVKNFALIPGLLKMSVAQNSGGLNTVGITLLSLLILFITVAYILISMIVDGVLIKNKKKIVTGVLFLALISFPVIFLFKDL